MAVSQSRNHRHTHHLPLAGADNYWASCQYVPLRASTCDGLRVRGLCMNPIYARRGRPTQPEPVAYESTSMSGSRAEIRPDSSLIPRREAAVRLSRSDRSQVQNLTVFRSRATASIMASGRCSRNLTPSIHPPLSLAFALCDSNLSCPCCCPCCPCCPCISGLDCFLSIASLFVSSRTLTRPDHTLLATSIVQQWQVMSNGSFKH